MSALELPAAITRSLELATLASPGRLLRPSRLYATVVDKHGAPGRRHFVAELPEGAAVFALAAPGVSFLLVEQGETLDYWIARHEGWITDGTQDDQRDTGCQRAKQWMHDEGFAILTDRRQVARWLGNQQHPSQSLPLLCLCFCPFARDLSPPPNYFSRFYSAKSHVKPPNPTKSQ